ncbi:hypothetical protein ES332_D04G066500v1 [Gossypium tomentosum]|uniref:PWWP domain-containing protein n=1 Tax=Gossypium tomentosum TaxID=34277 RepID=A0A5D2LAK7_GOSTO|nr:hypothetical protein ES332_D04G066500v1 [Gossypium tomentosum]TYH76156.1 hypothetical protein ES332_D04G066500v1 [Gossypium tomentosum]
MEAFEKPTETLTRDKSLDQDANEGSKAGGLTVERSWENGFRVSINGKGGSCVDEDGEGLEDSELNGVSSLLQMKGSVRNIDVNGGRSDSGEGFGTLLGAVDESKEIGAENVLPNDDDEMVELDEKHNGGKMMMNEIDDDDDDGDGGGGGVGGEFSAGYFVWGKIKSHPWWPGQVYNPTDASDYAVKMRQKGRLLVAYFGDSSFAWCLPSQLRPFEENFEDMSKLSSSKNFVNAVRTSVDEIGRLVESKMACSCVPKENCIGLDRPLAANAGIKEGVLVPEGGIGKVSVGLFEPKEVLGKLKQISQAVSTCNLLECAVLKGWLSAFNRSIGHIGMPVYYEPLSILDVEENVRTLVVDMSDYSEAVGIPITGLVEEDWISSSSCPKSGQGSRTLLRSLDISEDAMYHRRKQKSIAEILKGDLDVQAHKVSKSSKPASSSRRKKTKGNDKVNGDGGSDSSFVPRKGKGNELSGLNAEVDFIGANEGMDKVYSSRGRKTKIKQASDNDGDNRGKEDTDNQPVLTKRKLNVGSVIRRIDAETKDLFESGSFTRERKKSKYLSPPYTSSTGKLRKADIEDESVEVSSDTRFGETMSKATDNLVTGKGNEVPEEVHAEQEALNESNFLTPKRYPNQMNDLAKVEIPANEVLVEVRSMALSPQYQRKNSSFEFVVEFLSVFRSSVYRDGSDYEMYNQFEHQKRRKSPDFSTVSLGSNRSMAGHVPSGYKSHKKKVGKNEETKMGESKPRQATRASLKKTEKPKAYTPKRKQTAITAAGNDLPAALFVTFGPGSSLPTKDDLIRIYSRYGALDMEDTDMFFSNFCARVVFLRTSDAEQAFSSSQNDSPFGSANVSFRLRLHQAASAHNKMEIPSAKKPSLAKERSTKSLAPGNLELNYIKQKLETLTSMLETSEETMSSEAKSKIQSEIKGLLEMVNTMVESSSS